MTIYVEKKHKKNICRTCIVLSDTAFCLLDISIVSKAFQKGKISKFKSSEDLKLTKPKSNCLEKCEQNKI